VGSVADACTVGPTALGNCSVVGFPLPSVSATDAVIVFGVPDEVCHEVHTTIKLLLAGFDVKGTTHVVPEPLQLCADCTYATVANAGEANNRAAQKRSLFIFHPRADRSPPSALGQLAKDVRDN
jgi:hypothetical protein